MESQGDFVWYEDSKNHEFQFTVLTETIQGPSFDEEDMESEKVDINGHSATLFYTKAVSYTHLDVYKRQGFSLEAMRSSAS